MTLIKCKILCELQIVYFWAMISSRFFYSWVTRNCSVGTSLVTFGGGIPGPPALPFLQWSTNLLMIAGGMGFLAKIRFFIVFHLCSFRGVNCFAQCCGFCWIHYRGPHSQSWCQLFFDSIDTCFEFVLFMQQTGRLCLASDVIVDSFFK